MVMKSMKGKWSKELGDFTKRAEMTDCRSLLTYFYYWGEQPRKSGWATISNRSIG